jgi:hypothetical protein
MGGPSLVEIKAGADGSVYGLTSNALLYTWTLAAGWVEAPSALQTAGGRSLSHISMASAGNVMALTGAASNNVFVLDSAGTGWTGLSGETLSQAEIGPDGSVWGMTAAGAIWCYSSGSWWGAPWQLSNIAAFSAISVFGVNSSGQLMQWNGSALAAVTPAPNFTPSQARNALSAVSGSFLSILDTGGGIHLLNMLPQAAPLTFPINTATCSNIVEGVICGVSLSSIGGIQVGDSVTPAGNGALSTGIHYVVQSLASTFMNHTCSSSPCVWFWAFGTGTASGGTLTDLSSPFQYANPGAWSAVVGSASAITGNSSFTYVLQGGSAFHVNLLIPQLTATVAFNARCLRGCYNVWASATASFGGKGGAHGTAGVTQKNGGEAPIYLLASATEQGVFCDPIFDPSACDPPISAYCVPGSNPTDEICPSPLVGGIPGAGLAIVGLAYHLGSAQQINTTVECDVNINCTPATTPPLCPGPNQLVFGQQPKGTIASTWCIAHSPWVLYDPWVSFVFGGVTVVTCVNPEIGALPATGPVACTPHP